MTADAFSLRHPLLSACSAAHGFGLRSSPEPPRLVRARQVHGSAVALLTDALTPSVAEADAIVSTRPGVAVGVVTADCVPILGASRSGTVVAAIHAGWRGLAQGVIEAGMTALREKAGAEPLVAVIGPCIGVCCYEVDEPVLAALAVRFRSVLDRALIPTRLGRHRLDLLALARHALHEAGVADDALGTIPEACTRCDAVRFHSWRRDGPAAGRLLHHIAARRVDTPHPSP